MVLLKRFLLWIMLLQGVIVIAAGHGVGIMILLDCVALIDYADFIKEETFTFFPKKGSNDLGIAIIFSITGKLFTIVALFIKRRGRFFVLSLIGLTQLWLSYFYLSYHFTSDNAAYTAFITGLPFLLLSFLFIVFACMQWKNKLVSV